MDRSTTIPAGLTTAALPGHADRHECGYWAGGFAAGSLSVITAGLRLTTAEAVYSPSCIPAMVLMADVLGQVSPLRG